MNRAFAGLQHHDDKSSVPRLRHHHHPALRAAGDPAVDRRVEHLEIVLVPHASRALDVLHDQLADAFAESPSGFVDQALRPGVGHAQVDDQ